MSQMQIILTPEDYRKALSKSKTNGSIPTTNKSNGFVPTTNKSIGFVPTMGALHEGHATLLKKARTENEIVVLSIFVNPTQFNNPDDLAKYPKTFARDLEIAKECGVDFIFAPNYETLYPDQYKFEVREKEFSRTLCGAHRSGHFEGVLTVVVKLLNIVRPQKAYFGEKDFQQLYLIQEMVKAFFMDVEIVPVETVREYDGLAMSSRNQRLHPLEREVAPIIYRSMVEIKSAEGVRKNLEKNGFLVDYVTDTKGRRFVAAHLGNVRLIDNVKI